MQNNNNNPLTVSICCYHNNMTVKYYNNVQGSLTYFEHSFSFLVFFFTSTKQSYPGRLSHTVGPNFIISHSLITHKATLGYRNDVDIL